MHCKQLKWKAVKIQEYAIVKLFSVLLMLTIKLKYQI